MATYYITSCPQCFGYGFSLTMQERLHILALGTTKDVLISRPEGNVTDSCAGCKGTGWAFSSVAKKHTLPAITRKRW